MVPVPLLFSALNSMVISSTTPCHWTSVRHLPLNPVWEDTEDAAAVTDGGGGGAEVLGTTRVAGVEGATPGDGTEAGFRSELESENSI